MKKSLIKFFTPLLLIGFVGCDFEIPQTIKVKTKASYNFSLGDIEKDFGDQYSVKNFVSGSDSSSNAGVEIYDYNPDGKSDDVQQFLISKPVAKIPLDFGDYLKDSDLNSSLEAMEVKQKIEVPNAIDQTQNEELDLTSINSAINKGVLFYSKIVSGKAAISFAGDSEGVSFNKISYTTGTMVISETIPGHIPDGTSVTLTFTDGSSSSGSFANGSASLSLDGKTIEASGMKIEFSGAVGEHYKGEVTADSKIKIAENVTVDKTNPNAPAMDMAVTPVVVPNSSNGSYKSATVKTGELDVGMTLDSSWSGVDLSYKIKTSGGLDIPYDNVPGTPASPKQIDLADKTITPVDIKVEPAVDINLKNATINFEKKPVIKIDTKVQEFSSLTATLGSTAKQEINEEQKLSTAMTNYIIGMSFEECGLEIDYKNTLPVGNDLTLVTNSEFFGFTDKTAKLTANPAAQTSNTTLTTKNRKIKLGNDKTKTGADKEFNSVDLKASIVLPGAADAKSQDFTLTNVAPGESYEIDIAIKPLVKWTDITIRTNDPKEDTLPTSLNLTSLLDSFVSSSTLGKASSIVLSRLPIYLYFSAPKVGTLKDVKFRGKMEAGYGVQKEVEDGISKVAITQFVDDLDKVEILDGKTNDVMEIQPVPDLKATGDGELKLTTINLDSSAVPCSASADLAPLSQLAGVPEGSGLSIGYSLALTNSSGETAITVQASDLDGSTVREITVYSIIVLPLELKTAKQVDMDLFEMMGRSSDEDLFGRTGSSSNESIEEFMGILKSAKINYKFNKAPFIATKPVIFKINLGEEDMEFELGEGSVGLDRDLIQSIMATEKFVPNLNLHLEKDTKFSLPREMAINVHVTLSLETDGEVTIFGGDK